MTRKLKHSEMIFAYVDRETRDRIDQLAQDQDRPISAIVRRFVLDALALMDQNGQSSGRA